MRNSAAACYPRIESSLLPHCGQPREGDLRARAAQRADVAGPTACRAAVLQGLSEAPLA